ncbi:MAG: RNA pseudouridine synthase, partial [Oscillospiraceae bacterium]|nr:RNA pseudouridine synthase [Oscillospiraceae bacterium]
MEPILLTTEGERGTRLDSFLSAAVEDLTRAAAARLIEQGCVRVDGKIPSKSL